MPASPQYRTGTACLAALTPTVWGSTFVVTTELLPNDRPLLAATIRALPVGLAFVLWSRTLPSGSWWWRSALLGTLNVGAFFALLFVAAYRLPGGVAATASALQPLIATAIAAIVLGEAFTRRIAAAGAAGVAGVAMLVLGPEAALDPIGVLAAVGGAVSAATGVVLVKHWDRPVDLLTFTGWQLTFGGLLLTPVLLMVEGLPATLTAANVTGFSWIAIVGTGLAYTNWFHGIRRLPVSIIAFLVLLSPLVATIIGWVLLDERLNVVQVLGGALVVAAIVTPQTGWRAAETEDREDTAGAVGIDVLSEETPNLEVLETESEMYSSST